LGLFHYTLHRSQIQRKPSMSKRNEILTRAAIEYAQKGLKIVPICGVKRTKTKKLWCTCEEKDNCSAPGEHFIYPDLNPTSDEQKIRLWMHRYPYSNVAAIASASGGLVGFTCKSTEALERLKDAMPSIDWRGVPTVKVQYQFQLMFSYKGVEVDSDEEFLTDVEFLSDQEPIILPPSRHASGQLYRWSVKLCQRIPELPKSIIETLPRKKKKTLDEDDDDQDGDEDEGEFLTAENDREADRKKKNFTPKTAAELVAAPTPKREWIWEDFIPVASLFLIIAYMKVGKSTLTANLAVCVAQGISFLDHQTRQGGVLILAVEERDVDVQLRLRRFGMRREDPIFVNVGPLVNTPALRRELKEFITQNKISLVLIDSLSRFWSVSDENDNARVTRELSPILNLARDTGAAIGLIHHERKSGGDGGRNIRGGSALFALVDQAIFLDRRAGNTSNQRTLKTIGRYEQRDDLIIELRKDKYRLLGSRSDLTRESEIKFVEKFLGNKLRTISLIARKTELPEKTVRRALEALVRNGNAVRRGEGTRGDPFKYRLRSS